MTDPYAKLGELDRHHIFDAIDAQPDHLSLSFGDEMGQALTQEMGQGINNIVLAGMGGSALAPEVLRDWLYERLKVPFEIIRDYNLPGYINDRTLAIISSYSGNTEEALAAFKYAERMNCQIVVLTAGGKLLENARGKKYTLLKLPKVSQPRLSVFAALKALACLVADLGLSEGVDLERELLEAGNFLNTQKASLSLDDTHDNLARELALKFQDKLVLIYAGPKLRSAGYKWKIDIDENTKQLAFWNQYPELNHNEMQGWLLPDKKNLVSVQLESSLDNDRIKKRQLVTRQVLAKHGFEPIIVEAQGRTHLEQLLYTILLGDYVSAYLGILNGVDPTPVELVEKFKRELG